MIRKEGYNSYINVNINDDNDNNDDKKLNNQLLYISRIFGLILILISIYLSLTSSKLTILKLKLNNNFYIKSCDALGIPSSWKPYNDDNNARLPLYRYILFLYLYEYI
jgi:hypothetical protein